MIPPNPDYPVRLEIAYPDRLSRLLIFVKWLLAIPHFVVLFFLGIGAYVCWIISFFAVLITGRYPQGLFSYVVGVYRWGMRVGAYVFLMTDSYPPFSLNDEPDYPVHLEIAYPDRIARWRPLVQWLLVIPAAIAATGIMLAAEICLVIAWFAILFTARFPQALFNLAAVAFRWQMRVNAYTYWLTDRYPPFVWA